MSKQQPPASQDPNPSDESGTNQNGTQEVVEQQSGGNPAWNDILSDVPEEFHHILRPKLESWDKTVQDKLAEARSEFDAWKPFVENNIDPKIVENALQFAYEFENNPEPVIKKAIEHFNLNLDMPPNASDDDDADYDEDDEDSDDPRYAELMRRQRELEEQYAQDAQAQAEAEAEAQLDEYLESLRKEHGDFDEPFVLAHMMNGVSGEDAVKAFRSLGETYFKPSEASTPKPPVVMGNTGTPGSGLPADGTKMGDLSRTQVDELVANILNGNRQA